MKFDAHPLPTPEGVRGEVNELLRITVIAFSIFFIQHL